MKEITLNESFSKKSITFLIFCSLLISANMYARQHWNRNYFHVTHNLAENCLEMKFQFFDYNFGPQGQNGYLENCHFAYSTDGKVFHNLMRTRTTDQMHFGDWSWVQMTEKLPGAKIQFGTCYVPPAGTMWEENTDYKVELFNSAGNKAWFNIKWYLEQQYRDVKYIRLYGVWHVHAISSNDQILGVVFEIKNFVNSQMRSNISLHNRVDTAVVELPGNNETRVCAVTDAIVVKGAERGQNIKVYTASGALIKSIIATNDIEKIKLAANQIYIVNIEQNRHRVAL